MKLAHVCLKLQSKYISCVYISYSNDPDEIYLTPNIPDLRYLLTSVNYVELTTGFLFINIYKSMEICFLHVGTMLNKNHHVRLYKN